MAETDADMLAMLEDAAGAFARGVPRAAGEGRDCWREIGALGWLAILVGEDQGGLGLGFAHVACIPRTLGRFAVATPFAGGSMAVVLAAAGSDQALLADSIAGMRRVAAILPPLDGADDAFEYSEGRLTGEAGFVSPSDADSFVIALANPARLLRFDREAKGVSVAMRPCPDGTELAWLTLDAVPASLIGEADAVAAATRRAWQTGLLAVSAELLGAMDGALDLTLAYLRTREQFGAPIGTLQVLQHRAVDMWIQRQMSAAAVAGAVAVLDDPASDAGAAMRRVLGAKVRASEAARFVVTSALQLHGAIGFTEEYALAEYFNRVMALAARFGSAGELRRNYARTSPLLAALDAAA